MFAGKECVDFILMIIRSKTLKSEHFFHDKKIIVLILEVQIRHNHENQYMHHHQNISLIKTSNTSNKNMKK